MKKLRPIWTLLFLAYLAALLRLTVLRDGAFSRALFSGRLNLQPGYEYMRLISWGSYGRAAYLFFGNIAWFMPLGLYLHARGWDFAACALAGLLLSLLIECAQFVLGCGISETDDLLLNTLGAMAGYACLPFIWLLRKPRNKKA